MSIKIPTVSLPPTESIDDLRRSVELALNRTIELANKDTTLTDLSMNGHRITNLKKGITINDAATIGQIVEAFKAARNSAIATVTPSIEENENLPVPGPVTITVGSITKEYFTDPATREAQVRITIPYTAPLDDAFYEFSGVETYLEAPTELDATPLDPTGGTVYPQGWHAYTGVPGGAGTTVFVLPRPSRQEGWRFYLASRSDVNTETLVLGVATGATASTLVTVDPSTATNVSSFSITSYVTDDGSLKLNYTFTLPSGNGTDWSGYNWERVDIQAKSPLMASTDRITAASFDIATGAPASVVTSSSIFSQEGGTWTLYAVSFDSRGVAYTGGPSATIVVVAGPTQITEATITVTVPEYRTDSSGKQFGKVVVAYTPTANSDYPGVWVYEGVTPPADPAAAKYVTGSPWYAINGQSVEFWLERPEAGATFWAFVTANSNSITITPNTSTPKKTFALTAWGLSPQPTVFSVNVITGNNGGIPVGKFQFLFTKPTDPEYWYTMIERIATDSLFVPLVGASYQLIAGPIESDPAAGANVTNDWFPRPSTAEYWTFRATGMSQAGLPNTVSRPTSNVTVTVNTGVTLNQNAVTTLITNETSPDGFLGFITYNTSGSTFPTNIAPGIISIRSTTSGFIKMVINGTGDGSFVLNTTTGVSGVSITADNTFGGNLYLYYNGVLLTQVSAAGGGYIDLKNAAGTLKVKIDALTAAITLTPSILPTPVSGMITIDSGDSNKLKWYNGTSWQTPGTGTVTSVAQTVPSFLSISGSPVTTSGTLAITLATQTANIVFAGPTSGAAATPTFRSLVAADFPPTVCTTDTNQTISSIKTISGTIDFEGGSGVLKIQQKADSAGVPAGSPNEFFSYWDTTALKMRLVYKDGAGTGYYVDLI